MAGPKSSSGDIFDVERIRRLVALMNEHELTEVDLRQADQRIRIRKGHEPVVTSVSVPAATQPAVTGAEAKSSTAAAVAATNLAVIKSPMVGTYYAASSPDAPPFVRVGDRISPQTTVCVIEAMKVFNEIPAEISGQIAAVLVENGEPVEFGQPLFKVDTGK